jgi:hypothetical protein
MPEQRLDKLPFGTIVEIGEARKQAVVLGAYYEATSNTSLLVVAHLAGRMYIRIEANGAVLEITDGSGGYLQGDLIVAVIGHPTYESPDVPLTKVPMYIGYPNHPQARRVTDFVGEFWLCAHNINYVVDGLTSKRLRFAPSWTQREDGSDKQLVEISLVPVEQ